MPCVRVHAAVAALSAALLAASGVRAQSAGVGDTLLQVNLYEARGRLDSARALLQAFSGRDTPEVRAHLAILLKVDSALARSHAYLGSGAPELAEHELAALSLDTAQAALLLTIDREKDFVRTLLGSERGSAALTVARRLAQQRNYELAIAQYSRVQADSGDRFPQGIQYTAAAELERVRRQKAEAEGFSAGFRKNWVEARNGLGKLAVWLLLVGAAALLVWAIRKAVQPRRGAVLEVEDMTVDANPDGAKVRLLRDISRAVRVIADTRATSIGQNVEDLDGVANLRIGSPVMEEINRLVADGTLQLGPVAINPKQLATLFGMVQERPFETTLKGYLTADDATTVLFIERYDIIRKKRVKHPRYYQTQGTRRKAIQDFAIRYIFDHSEQKPTADFTSFSEYCWALDELEAAESAADSGEALAGVRAHLERSVSHDPSNWLARFKLGEVLRKSGDYGAALFHFQRLKELNDAEASRPPSLRAYIRGNPDFPFVIDYNLALTLSLGFDADAQQKAIEQFTDLIQRIEEAA